MLTVSATPGVTNYLYNSTTNGQIWSIDSNHKITLYNEIEVTCDSCGHTASKQPNDFTLNKVVTPVCTICKANISPKIRISEW